MLADNTCRAPNPSEFFMEFVPDSPASAMSAMDLIDKVSKPFSIRRELAMVGAPVSDCNGTSTYFNNSMATLPQNINHVRTQTFKHRSK